MQTARRELPNPRSLLMTRGVFSMQGKGFANEADDYMFNQVLQKTILEAYNKEPDEAFDGGNDKFFFSFMFRGTKLFAAVNEINGLTVMLPSEY
jgi:hypothetical protein